MTVTPVWSCQLNSSRMKNHENQLKRHISWEQNVLETSPNVPFTSMTLRMRPQPSGLVSVPEPVKEDFTLFLRSLNLSPTDAAFTLVRSPSLQSHVGTGKDGLQGQLMGWAKWLPA
jgi:hypothetical protein